MSAFARGNLCNDAGACDPEKICTGYCIPSGGVQSILPMTPRRPHSLQHARRADVRVRAPRRHPRALSRTARVRQCGDWPRLHAHARRRRQPVSLGAGSIAESPRPATKVLVRSAVSWSCSPARCSRSTANPIDAHARGRRRHDQPERLRGRPVPVDRAGRDQPGDSGSSNARVSSASTSSRARSRTPPRALTGGWLARFIDDERP